MTVARIVKRESGGRGGAVPWLFASSQRRWPRPPVTSRGLEGSYLAARKYPRLRWQTQFIGQEYRCHCEKDIHGGMKVW